MKHLLILATLSLSLTSAYSADFQTEGNLSVISNSATFVTLSSTTDFNICKEAYQVINDAQDFNATGVMSALLESKVSSQLIDSQDLSVNEAVDAVVIEAQNILK